MPLTKQETQFVNECAFVVSISSHKYRLRSKVTKSGNRPRNGVFRKLFKGTVTTGNRQRNRFSRYFLQKKRERKEKTKQKLYIVLQLKIHFPLT